jgi:hypothetical protein
MDEETNAKDFIAQEFKAHGIRYRELSNDFSIYCPFFAHSGNKMLLQVRFDGQVIHCWSCHTAGTYNKLADKLGLKRLPASVNSGYGALDKSIREAYLERGLPALPLGLKPVTEPYRGLSPEFLRRFKSQLWYDTDSMVYRILWPISYNGKLQGYTAGRLDGETMPKYRHGPSGVIQTTRVLWPIDDPAIRDTVVLTEGPFSALRLLHEGIPAIATLGATMWHSSKITMMQQRKRPIRGVIIAFDADSAGEAGADRVYESIKDVFERVERFDCPLRKQKYEDADGKKYDRLDRNGDPILEGTDPGDMPAKYVEKLRSLYEDVRSSLQRKRPAMESHA